MFFFFALLVALGGKKAILTHDQIDTFPRGFNTFMTQTDVNLFDAFGDKGRARYDLPNGRQQRRVIQLNLGAGPLTLMSPGLLVFLPEIIIIRRLGYAQHKA
jgi:hypothetical protein